MIVGGGAAILLIIGVIVFSLIFSGGKGQTELLTELAQQQTEIIRIADIGADKGRSSETRALAYTIKLTVTSDSTSTLASLKKSGRTLSPKDLSLKKDSKTDQLLASADKGNTFDETFVKKINSMLETYQKSVKTAFDSSTKTAEKQLLNNQYRNAGTILATKTD